MRWRRAWRRSCPCSTPAGSAVVLNVGTLVQPTSKTQYTAKSVPLPPKLFSHNDQQSFWQASNPEGATSGWGGRIGDLLQSRQRHRDASPASTRRATRLPLGPDRGPVPGHHQRPGAAARQQRRAAVRLDRRHEHAARADDRAAHASVRERAYAASPSARSTPGAGHRRARRRRRRSPRRSRPATRSPTSCRIVARLISVSQELGAKRQVFFVSLGGFDNHDCAR